MVLLLNNCNRSNLQTEFAFVLIDRCLADFFRFYFRPEPKWCLFMNRCTPSPYESNIRLQMNRNFFFSLHSRLQTSMFGVFYVIFLTCARSISFLFSFSSSFFPFMFPLSSIFVYFIFSLCVYRALSAGTFAVPYRFRRFTSCPK